MGDEVKTLEKDYNDCLYSSDYALAATLLFAVPLRTHLKQNWPVIVGCVLGTYADFKIMEKSDRCKNIKRKLDVLMDT